MRPRAIEVRPLSDYKLIVTFGNNEKRVFDVEPYMSLKPFENLKNKKLFDTVHVAGLSVEWLTGQDLCPDELYYNSIPLE